MLPSWDCPERHSPPLSVTYPLFVVLLSPSDAGVLSHNGTLTIGWLSNLHNILYSSMGTPIMAPGMKETLISLMKTLTLLPIAGEVTWSNLYTTSEFQLYFVIEILCKQMALSSLPLVYTCNRNTFVTYLCFHHETAQNSTHPLCL